VAVRLAAATVADETGCDDERQRVYGDRWVLVMGSTE
jgi:hypothetical protein